MELKKKIQEDLKAAVKERDQICSGTLRMLLAAITNKEKEALRLTQGKDKELSDEEIQGVLATEAKKRREAKEAFEKGDRQELADKEKQELEVLLKYLPEQLTEDEIRQLVKEAIQKTGATEQKDIGKVMAELASQVKGKSNGFLVASIVKELLTSE